LSATPNLTAQAAALVVESQNQLPFLSQCDGNDCKAGMKAYQASMQIPTAKLANLARTSDSPQVYSWALTSCEFATMSSSAPSECSGLSTQRWAQIAPDNAWPWLALASEARRSSDTSGEESAMYRASHASDWSDPGDVPQRLLLSNLPEEASDSTRLGSIGSVRGFTTTNLLRLGSVSAYCGAGQDANRRQSCQGLANHILDNASSMLELSFGITIAERSGLSHEKVSVASATLEQARSAKTRVNTLDDPGNTCESYERQIKLDRRVAEVGELKALNEEAIAHAP
jgi:hypothetical protein